MQNIVSWTFILQYHIKYSYTIRTQGITVEEPTKTLLQKHVSGDPVGLKRVGIFYVIL
jgi:hypothetical protein